MNEKTMEELFPVIVKAYNQRNYEYASMVTWFIYSQVEETKMNLSRINIARLSTAIQTCL